MLCCWTPVSSASSRPPGCHGPWLCQDCRVGAFGICDSPGALSGSVLPEGESELSGVRGPHPVQRKGRVAGRPHSRRSNRISSASPEPERALLSVLCIVVQLEPFFSRKWKQGHRAQAPVIGDHLSFCPSTGPVVPSTRNPQGKLVNQANAASGSLGPKMKCPCFLQISVPSRSGRLCGL